MGYVFLWGISPVSCVMTVGNYFQTTTTGLKDRDCDNKKTTADISDRYVRIVGNRIIDNRNRIIKRILVLYMRGETVAN